MKNYYQIALDVDGRPCLVVGGGEEAVEKVDRLLEAGAAITVVSPRVAPELEAWERQGSITICRRRFAPEDAEGVFLVQNCVKSDAALSAHLYRLSEEKRFLLGSWDQPGYSNYTMPALVRRGRLRVAVSTGAASPSLAAALRRQMEAIFDDEFVAYLDWLAERRRAIEEAESDQEKRNALFRQGVSGFRLEGSITYPEAFREREDTEEGA